MKNSGIEWIGEIPDSWEYFRLKDYYLFEKGKNAAIYTQDYIGLNKGDYPVYSGQTENEGVMGMIDTFDYDIDECLFTTTVGAKVMTPKILRGKFSLSQNCLIMKKTKECNNSYIYYYLFPLFSYAKSLIPTYMQPSLRVADLNLYGFYVPDCETQYKIAKCLNEKCGKIDELIANQEKQIEKLKEYKQSVITEAVTKGLDKSAPLKDSGIEWIGKIPENWEVSNLGNLLKEHKQLNDEVNSNALQFKFGTIIRKKEQNLTADVVEMLSKYNVVEPNIIMVNGLNLAFDFITQRVAIVEEEGVITSTYLAMKPTSLANPKYFTYLLKSYDYQKALHAMGRGLRSVLSYETFRKEKVLLPKFEDQQQIVDYLDEKCDSIDRLIEIKQEKIEKLNEYKKSLIYEYVTGKKEVV